MNYDDNQFSPKVSNQGGPSITEVVTDLERSLYGVEEKLFVQTDPQPIAEGLPNRIEDITQRVLRCIERIGTIQKALNI